MRLRQIALETPELRGVEQEICTKLGLEVCYRDPGLSHFGLRHGLYAIGDQILELVAPKEPDTTAERFLERRQGEGGYMVLLQTQKIEQHKSRLEENNIRVIHDGKITKNNASIRGIHLHPRDVGGAILSLDEANPAESWLWAGQDWQYHSVDTMVTKINAIELQADDPELMAEQWSKATGLPSRSCVIDLENAVIRFVNTSNKRGDGLTAAYLVAKDRNRAGESLRICGFDFRLV